jgi:hypothetical protein
MLVQTSSPDVRRRSIVIAVLADIVLRNQQNLSQNMPEFST